MLTNSARRWALRLAGLGSLSGLLTCGGGDVGPSGPGLNASASTVSFTADFGTVPDPATITITTTGGQATGLTASVSFSGTQSDWLGAEFDTDVASATEAATLTLQVTRPDLPVGSHAATVAISSANAGNTPRVTVGIEVVATEASRLALLTPPPETVRSGEPFSQAPVVQLQNEAGDPVEVEGVQVTVALQGDPALDGPVTVETDAGGVATFGGLTITGLVGERTLVFQAPGVPDLSSGPITVTAGDPARIEAVSNQSQNKQAGQRVDEPPRVRVQDSGGNPSEGVEVTFAVTAGGGTIAPTDPVATGADGEAALELWELGPTAGANTVTASADGLTGSPVEFNATGTVGVATDLTIVSPNDLQGPVSSTITHRVRVTDNTGNNVPGISVQWSAESGGGSVDPASSLTNLNGVANTVRTLGPAPGVNTTVASATLNGVLKTVTFTMTANIGGPAQTVLVSGDDQTGAVGAELDDPLQVGVLDADGVPQSGVTVTWAILSGDGSFPSGETSVTNGDGIASATWQLGNVAGEQTARASAAGPAVLFTATANPGPPNAGNTTLLVSPTFITAGAAPATVTATVQDQFGNLIGGASVNLSSDGSSFTFGDPTLTTATSGANLGKASTTYGATDAGTHTITATISAGGPAINKSVLLDVRAAGASKMTALTSTSGSASFGAGVPGPLPAVLVTDQFDNPIANVAVSWSLIRGKGFISSPAQTNASGVSALSSWALTALSPGYDPSFDVLNQVRATSGTLTGSPITFTRTVQVAFANVQTLFGNVVSATTAGTCLGSGCHNGTVLALDLRPTFAYPDLIAGGAGFTYVIPSDSSTVSSTQNRLLFRLKNSGPSPSTMPPSSRGGKLPANIISIIAAWVAQGAPAP